VGLDGHQRGIQVIARAWTQAGFEVVYLGLRNTPEGIARAAVHEDAAVVGLSILSGAHLHLTRATRQALDAAGGSAIPLIVGGVIPVEDVAEVRAAGAVEVLRPGSPLAEVVDAVYRATGRERPALS